MIRLLKYSAIRNSLWIILEKLVRLTIGVLVSALLARYLEPAGFGKLSFLLALLSILAVVCNAGLNRIIVREVVLLRSCGDAKASDELIATAFAVRVAVTLSVVVLAIGLAGVFDPGQLGLYALAFCALIFMPTDVIDLYQQGAGSLRFISVCRTVSFLVSSALRLSLIAVGASLEQFVLAVVLEYAITSALFLLAYRLHHRRQALNLSQIRLKRGLRLMSESWPEVIAGFGGILFMRMDQVMLNAILGAESVGIYSAAARLAEAWYFIPGAIVTATFPFVLRGKSISERVYRERLRLLFTALLGLSIFMGVVITFSADLLVYVLYGDSYALSSEVLVIQCWAGIFVFLGSASGSALAAEHRLRWNLYRNLFGLFINIILNYLLIYRYGAIGAAVATLCSLASAYLLFDLLFKPMRPMFLNKLSAFNILWVINSKRMRRVIRDL